MSTDECGVLRPAEAEDTTEPLSEDTLAREEELLARKRQLRILRFKVRWMDTLAERARRELAAAGADGRPDGGAVLSTPPEMSDLEAAVNDQMEVVGEAPVSPHITTSDSVYDRPEDSLFSQLPIDEE